MINIILSASQQSWNKCIMGDSEEDHTYAIAEKVALILQNYYCNVFVIAKSITGTETETLNQVVNASNNFANTNSGKNFHLDIHTDGGYAGKGASGFYFSENGRQFINAIHAEVSKITPWLDGGTSKRDLFVLRATYSVAGLIELSFHDVYNQAKHIHENMDLYAQAIVRGLVQACGLEEKKNVVDPVYKNCVDLVAAETDITPEFWYKAQSSPEEFLRGLKTEWVVALIQRFANYVHRQTGI